MLEYLQRIRVVTAVGRFGQGRFGHILGWVDSAYVGGSFRPWVVSAQEVGEGTQLKNIRNIRAFPQGGGGGGGTLIFSHIRRLGLFFGVQNSEFQ